MLFRDEQGVRWLPVGAIVAAVVVGGYLAHQRWWPDDSATEVTVDEVLDRYRDEVGAVPSVAASGAPVDSIPAPTAVTTTVPPIVTTAATTEPTDPPPTSATATPPTNATTTPTSNPTAAPPALPVPGVYRYATDGREHITALGGTDHAYPAETALTVTPRGCGVALRWDLLAERYEEWSLCITGDAIALGPTGVQFHQFYGQAQTDVVECDAVVPLNPAPAVGTAIDRDCRLAGEPWHPVWTAGPAGTATVDGVEIATTSFDVTIELGGEYPEHSTQHWTFGPDGLPISITIDMESANPSPVGSVTYTETIGATLVSLRPLE